MLDIGWSEFFLIGVLALLVLGPKDLTRLAFLLGHWVGQARQAISDLHRAFEDMAEELESGTNVESAEEDSSNQIAPPMEKPPNKKLKRNVKPKNASKKIRKKK